MAADIALVHRILGIDRVRAHVQFAIHILNLLIGLHQPDCRNQLRFRVLVLRHAPPVDLNTKDLLCSV